jgi:hypothetical protein
MNQNTITYLVEFFTNNNIIKTEYITNVVDFKMKKNLRICTLTNNEIVETLRKNVADLESAQCDIKFGVATIDGISYIGMPNSVKVNLNTFQMRKIKLAFIDELLNEA